MRALHALRALLLLVVTLVATGVVLIIAIQGMEVSTVSCKCPLPAKPVTPSTPSATPTEDSAQDLTTIAAALPSSEAATEAMNPITNPLSTYLLIMMPIRPDAFEKRRLIRLTWYKGYDGSKEVTLKFVIGKKAASDAINERLMEERATYNDVVVVNHKEGPRALTNKTIAMMKWASDNVNFTYMMKCDDDTYVYVDNVINELKRRPTTTNLYYGKIIYDGSVMRNRKLKWSDPTWDLGDTYMPYALGGGYILSSDLVVMLAEQADYLKWHPNEDTAVGSWLVPYEYERRSDDLVCVTDINGTLKYKCVEKFPIFHIFYCFPNHQSGMVYFHKLYKEYSAFIKRD